MFVTADELAQLTSAIEALDLNLPEWRDKYLASGKTHKRFRWDVLYAMPSDFRYPFFDAIYGRGGNDDHIDTALRKALP